MPMKKWDGTQWVTRTGGTQAGSGGGQGSVTYELRSSATANGTYSALTSANISANFFVRLFITSSDPGDIQYVVWYVDGVLHRDDDLGAPYDLTYLPGSYPYESLTNGSHTIRADIHRPSGVTQVSSTFTISGSSGGEDPPDDPPPATTGVYGPQTTTWITGFTPAYATPATITTAIVNLNTALNSATAGDVIEVTGPTGGTVTLTNQGGTAGGNVLVRPPLGQRVHQAFHIKGSYITVAGFDGGGHRIGQGSTNVVRSGFWRSVCATSYYAHTAPCEDTFFVECVTMQRKPGGQDDQAKINGGDGDGMVINPRFEACWIRGTDRVSSADHGDTIQITLSGSGRTSGFTLLNSYIEDSQNAAIQAENFYGDVTIVGNFFRGTWYDAIGQNGGAETFTIQFPGKTSIPEMSYLTYVDNQAGGKIAFGRAATPCFEIDSWSGNVATGGASVNGGASPGVTNTTTSVPDLVGTLWPTECPKVVNLPGSGVLTPSSPLQT